MPSNTSILRAPAISRSLQRAMAVRRSSAFATTAAGSPQRIWARSLPPSAGPVSRIPRVGAWVWPTSRPWCAATGGASRVSQSWARARPLPLLSQPVLKKGRAMPDIQDVTILLVEDDPGHTRLIEQNLRRANIKNEIAFATNGQEALDYLFCEGAYANNKHASHMLVLIDLNMPVLDGYQVLERMKKDERTKRIPVVILTPT